MDVTQDVASSNRKHSRKSSKCEAEIEAVVNKLATHKSPGIDSITVEMITNTEDLKLLGYVFMTR